MAPRLPKSGMFASQNISEGLDPAHSQSTTSISPRGSMSLKKAFSITSFKRRLSKSSSSGKPSMCSDSYSFSQHNNASAIADDFFPNPSFSTTNVHTVDPFASTTSIRTTHIQMSRSVSTLSRVESGNVRERRRSASQKVSYADVEKALQMRDIEMLNRNRAERRLSEAHSEMEAISARGDRLSQQVEETRVAMSQMQKQLGEMKIQLDQEKRALADVEKRAKMAERAAEEERAAAEKVYMMYVSLAFEHSSLKMTLADIVHQSEEDLRADAEQHGVVTFPPPPMTVVDSDLGIFA